MTVLQETNLKSKLKVKLKEDCNLTDKEIKIAVMKKLNKLQENLERHFNDLRNKINEEKKYFTEEIETLKKEPNRNLGAEELNK